MGERTQYTPGTFSSTDLATPHHAGSKAVYMGLFGWQSVENPIGEDMVYSMMQVGGKDVAADHEARSPAARIGWLRSRPV